MRSALSLNCYFKAGGASVHYLLITEQTKGLFHRAIVMSGTAFNKTWALTLRSNQAERLARKLGWKGKAGSEREILEFLENVPAFELDNASRFVVTEEDQFGRGELVPFGPVIEPYISDNCIITKEPVLMARETWSNAIDVIMMGTSFEGQLNAFGGEEETMNYLQNPGYFAPLLDLGLEGDDEKAIEYGTKIKKLYYNDGEEPSMENQEQYLRVRWWTINLMMINFLTVID